MLSSRVAVTSILNSFNCSENGFNIAFNVSFWDVANVSCCDFIISADMSLNFNVKSSFIFSK